MSKLIGSPSAKSALDEMIETTREANAEFLKEIEKEKQEAERKAIEDEAERKKRQKEGFADIDKKLNELIDPDYKPKPHNVDVFPPAVKPVAPKEKLGKRLSNYFLDAPPVKSFGRMMFYFALPLVLTTFGAIRYYRERSEETNYTAECVTATRYVGYLLGQKLDFKACNDGKRTINEHDTAGYNLMTDSNSDGLVDVLEENRTIYTKPNSMIDEVQEDWKDDWEALDADEILKGWAEWKGRQR